MPLRETYLYLCIRLFVNWYQIELCLPRIAIALPMPLQWHRFHWVWVGSFRDRALLLKVIETK
jgi:hypothetical protein